MLNPRTVILFLYLKNKNNIHIDRIQTGAWAEQQFIDYSSHKRLLLLVILVRVTIFTSNT